MTTKRSGHAFSVRSRISRGRYFDQSQGLDLLGFYTRNTIGQDIS